MKFSSIEQVDNLTGAELREAVKEEANREDRRNLTLGLLLWRVKRERWFEKWWWRKISDYYTKELPLSIKTCELAIANIRRCISFDMTLEEMQIIERQVANLTRISAITRYATTKKHVLKIARTANNMSFSEMRRKLGYNASRIEVEVEGFQPADRRPIHLVTAWLSKKLPQRRRPKVFVVPFLVVLALIDANPGERKAKFKRLLIAHDLDIAKLPEIFREGE